MITDKILTFEYNNSKLTIGYSIIGITEEFN